MTGPPGSVIEESTMFTLQTAEQPPPSSDQLQNFFFCMSSQDTTPICQPNTYSPLFALNVPAAGGSNSPTNFPNTPMPVTSSTTSFVTLLGNPTTVPVSAVQTYVPQITSGPDGSSTFMVPQSEATQSTITRTLNSTSSATPTPAAATPTAPAVAKTHHNSGLSAGAKIGIAVGAIGGIVLLGLLIFCCRHKRRIPRPRMPEMNMPKMSKVALPRMTMPRIHKPKVPKIPFISIQIKKRRNGSPIENLMESTMRHNDTSRDLLAEKMDMMAANSSADEDDAISNTSFYEDAEPSPCPKHSPVPPVYTPSDTLSPIAAAVTANSPSHRPKHQRNQSSLSIPSNSPGRHKHSRSRSGTGDLLDEAGLSLDQQKLRAGDSVIYGDAQRSPAAVVHPSPLLLPPPTLHLNGQSSSALAVPSPNNLAIPTLGANGGRGGSGISGVSFAAPFLTLEPGMSAEEIERLEEEERRIDEAIAAAERVATPRPRSERSRRSARSTRSTWRTMR